MKSNRLSRKLRRGIGLTLGIVMMANLPARAQEYVFTKIVDNNDPIPNGGGTLFGIVDPEPAFNGGTVVFRNGPGALAPDSIWSVTNSGTFTKLVDLNTAIPDGTGNFSAPLCSYRSSSI